MWYQTDGIRQLTVFGDNLSSGAYVLGLTISRALPVAFGQYHGGRPVEVRRGSCIYVGSALGAGAALWHRMARHARRSKGQPGHDIRHMLERYADRLGGPRHPSVMDRPKHLRWHIDYLLDSMDVSLDRIIAVRTDVRLESSLAEVIDGLPAVAPVAPGLGAGDAPGQTHLWAAPHLDACWSAIEERIDVKWNGRALGA